ncbi:hypothetical protein ACOMHN_041902 [Nucella lapillus]
MEGSPGKQDKKFSRRSFKSSRSATLPAGAVLTRESGEGFFSKIRRSFKIRKKGKFVLQHAHDDTEISGGAGLAGLSHSADSLQNADAENNGVRGRFKSNKMPQESGEDDKNSVLVRSESGKCSPGDSGLLPSDENVCEGEARVSGDADQSQSQGKQAGDGDTAASSDVFLEDKDNNNDKFIDDFDPDYETLDNIRRKLHDHHNNSDQNPLTDTAVMSVQEAQRLTMSCMSKSWNGQEHQDKTEPTYQELKSYSSSSGFPQSFENSFPEPRNSSASYHTSYTSPSAPTFPAAHSTTNGAPDLGEGVRRGAGRDTQVEVRPQGGHLRQRFLQSSGAARSWEEIPQPLPTPQGASGRKAVSEELPLKRTQKDLEHQSRKNRRHSSAVDTSRAHSDFMTSMKQLKECGWYWGPLSREEAVDKLRETCDGSFLVRDSANDKYLLAISFKHSDHVHHTRIEFHKGLFSFWEHPDEHSKAHICQFIEQTVEHSRKGNYIHFQRSPNSHANPLSIQLLYPVSRFYRVPSLQHVCRFLILCRVRRDLIHRLPLPEKIKGYLSEKQYYVEMLTED